MNEINENRQGDGDVIFMLNQDLIIDNKNIPRRLYISEVMEGGKYEEVNGIIYCALLKLAVFCYDSITNINYNMKKFF